MIIAIIQARMGSTRLPGKVLMEVNGIPLLKYQIERVQNSSLINKLVIATSTLKQDDEIFNFCIKNEVECFRGSENDVLSRYYECAIKYKAKDIVRLTADCPLADPVVIDNLIKLYKKEQVDYAANTVPLESCTHPEGSDVEVFSFQAFEKINKECNNPKDREHVTFDFWKNGNDYRIAQLQLDKNCTKYRYTVDYPEDFEVIKFVINELKQRNSFGYTSEIVEIIEANPKIKEKNAKYYFGIGW